MKRKVNQMVGGEDDSKSAKPKKRVKIGPKEILNKVRKQISNATAPAVAPVDPSAAQLLKDQRAKRAAERAAKEEAERVTKKENVSDVEGTPRKTQRRRSMSTTLAVSDLPRTSSKASRKSTGMIPSKRASASPAKKMSALKNRVQGSPMKGGRRTSSQTPLLKQSAAAPPSAEPKTMKQSRLSFGFGGIGFNVSPKKQSTSEDDANENDEALDLTHGLQVPKRSSSLKVGSSIARPSTAKSLAKSVTKVAATAKLGVKGDKAVRKTIRAVSGAD